MTQGWQNTEGHHPLIIHQAFPIFVLMIIIVFAVIISNRYFMWSDKRIQPSNLVCQHTLSSHCSKALQTVQWWFCPCECSSWSVWCYSWAQSESKTSLEYKWWDGEAPPSSGQPPSARIRHASCSGRSSIRIMIGGSTPQPPPPSTLMCDITQRILLRTEELWRSFDLIWKPMENHLLWHYSQG